MARKSGLGSVPGARLRSRAAPTLAASSDAATTASDDAAAAKKSTRSKGRAKGKGSGSGSGSGSGESKNADARRALAKAMEAGEPVSGRVEVANRGGLILRIFNGRFRAFLPLSQMASSRTVMIKAERRSAPRAVTASFASFDDDEEDFIPPPVVAPAETAQTKGDKDAGKDAVVAALEKQVGNTIDVMITSVESSKIVVSERLLAQSRGASALAVGASASGVVVSLSDFGAFVELSEDDPQAPRLEGLIHISELSWNRISHPRDVVRVGDEVDVKVLDVAPASGSRPARVTFSLKQLQADPLLETLDTIMPVAMPEPSVDEDELTDTPLPGLTDICSNLLTEEGIDAVIPGRQAVEQRVVSQDLELWLTNVVVEDGYNLLARAGRQVQEIHVVTGLDRDAIKRAIKRATNGLK
jgi:predicted RNA-binding protein with RPS1 domain